MKDKTQTLANKFWDATALDNSQGLWLSRLKIKKKITERHKLDMNNEARKPDFS